MARTKKLSKEEQLLRKRLRERVERYQKIKDDPVKRALMKEKEKKKYDVKKKKKQRKLAKDMTPRESRCARNKWKKYSADHYKKKKKAEVGVFIDSPPISDNEEPLIQIIPHQRNSGRKKIHRDRSKVIERNRKLLAENSKLEKSRNLYKTRYYRLINKCKSNANHELTPRTKIRRIIKSKDKELIARQLLFGEVFEAQLKSNVNSIECKKTRSIVISKMLGKKEILKKYKVVGNVQKMIPFRPARYCLNNNITKKVRNEALRMKIKNDVKKFFENDENSRMAPGKKDCITRKKIKKQKRFLNETMLKLYPKFRRMSGYKISYSFFCKLRPFWVVYQKLDDRDTCQCKKHVNCNYVVTALHKNNIIKQKTAKEIAENLCCEGYNVNCLLRKCSKCSNKNIVIDEFDGDTEVFYYNWTHKTEQYKSKNGQVNSVKNTVKLCIKTTAYSLVKRLYDIIPDFMKHEAIIRNQFSALNYLKHNMDDNEALLQMDFSENYSLKHAEEIQSFHFGGSRKQVTLHTSSLLMKDNAYEPLKVKSFCTMSEDLRHDSTAVFAHLKPVFHFLQNEKPSLKALHLLSDSPSGQYRNKSIFYQFGHLLDGYFPKLKYATWNYLESGHGKGMPDGIGGTVKRTADRLVTEGKDVATFETLVNKLKDNLQNIHIEVVSEAEINESKKKVNEADVKTFKGSMKVHQVLQIFNEPSNKLWMKSMSCFKCFYKSSPTLMICDHYKLGCLDYNIGLESSCEERFGNAEEIVVEPDQYNQELYHEEVQNKDTARKITEEEDKFLLDSPSMDPSDIQAGIYLIVNVKNEKNVPFKYLAVCSSGVEDNGEVEVTFLKRAGENDLFKVVENDTSYVHYTDIDQILPPPNLKIKGDRLFYQFDMGHLYVHQ